MRRSTLVVPFLVLVLSAVCASHARAQVSPGIPGGNALAPSTEGAATGTHVARLNRAERIAVKRLTPSPWASRVVAPWRPGFAISNFRWLVRFVR